jgi:putative transposase
MIPALRKEGHPVRKSRFTQEQIAFALRQAESGTAVPEVWDPTKFAELCGYPGLSQDGHLGEHPFDSAQGRLFYRWKRRYEGLGVAEIRRLRQLEEENRRLKQIVADLSLDKEMLQNVIRKKL